MLRPITLTFGTLTSGVLAAVLLAGGLAQAEPRMTYTRHALKINLSDLDLGSDAGQRLLQVRIADAADEVCGGRPDRDNRYTKEELQRMLPAYDKCHADAMRQALTSLHLPDMAKLAQTGSRP